MADKGYSSNTCKDLCDKFSYKLYAPNKSNFKKNIFDMLAYNQYVNRFKVERAFAWIKNFRKIRTRYECKIINFKSWIELACSLIEYK